MSNYYDEFLTWAESRGLEFPCTAQVFYARAAEFAAGVADNDAEMIEIISVICRQGIGPDWQD